jgi:hypothetical protein
MKNSLLKTKILEKLYQKQSALFRNLNDYFPHINQETLWQIVTELINDRLISRDIETTEKIMVKITDKGIQHFKDSHALKQQNQVKQWLQIGILGAGTAIFALSLTFYYSSVFQDTPGFRAEIEFNQESAQQAFAVLENYLKNKGETLDWYNISLEKDQPTEKNFLIQCQPTHSECQDAPRYIVIEKTNGSWEITDVESLY